MTNEEYTRMATQLRMIILESGHFDTRDEGILWTIMPAWDYIEDVPVITVRNNSKYCSTQTRDIAQKAYNLIPGHPLNKREVKLVSIPDHLVNQVLKGENES